MAVLAALAIVASLPMYAYQWHRLLHIAGAVLFLGNIIVTAAWMLLAGHTRDRAVLAFASRSVVAADFLFTAPGIVLVLLNGLALASMRYGGWADFHQTSWILTALGLFALSGVVWAGFLLRCQVRLVALSGEAVRAGVPMPAEYFSVLRRWYFWGTIATLLPLVSLALMIYKPSLW